MKYHKINSVFKRDDNKAFTSEFSCSEFEYLFDSEWIGTEKIDGANISIRYDNEAVTKHGKTDKAIIPEHLDKRLDEIISSIDFDSMFEGGPVALYGEGYGHKIRKVGKKYLGDKVDFILFDVRIGHWWLKREDVDSIASSMGLKSVPTLYIGTLREAINVVKAGFKSNIGELEAEGMVLTPKIGLLGRSGGRIITKLKTKDFREN